MNRFYQSAHHRWLILGSSCLLLLSFILPYATPFGAQQPLVAQAADRYVQNAPVAPQVDWLEPRGLSIASLVGLVPEEHLKNAIIAFRSGYGLIQYLSGERNGETVTVNAKLTPRYLTFGNDIMTRVGCLGQMGVYDEWMGAVAAAKMRVFAGGTEITNKAVYVEYTYAGQKMPDEDVSNYFRYSLYKGNPSFATDGALDVPANMGCTYVFSGRYTDLTAQFVIQDSAPIQVETLGDETFTFHSYIGVGSGGQLEALRNQMTRRFGDRHEKFVLHPPEGAEYFLLAYPPTPAEAYPDTMADDNVPLASGGTYRIGRQQDNTLSVDHTASMAMPLHGQWQDADQADGDYLRFFSDGTRLASPEYFLPAGVAYDPCMRFGGCSEALLDQIFATEMQMTIHYYRITRVADGLTRVPLKQVGSRWKSVVAAQADTTAAAAKKKQRQDDVVFLPLIRNPKQPTPVPTPQVPADDPSGCPCGWFDSIGRMWDYIAPQP